MSKTKKLNNITPKQIADKGVQALGNRPNASSQYGVGGLSPAQLKLWFDKLATFLAEKINELQNALSSEDAAAYIRLLLDEQGVENLDDLIKSFSDGTFAQNILQVFPSINNEQTISLQQLINDCAKKLSEHSESIRQYGTDKLDKVKSKAYYRRAYIVDADGTQKVIYISETPLAGALPVFAEGGQINVATPIEKTQAANKEYVDQQDLLLGSKVLLSIDTSTNTVILRLENSEGKELNSSIAHLPSPNDPMTNPIAYHAEEAEMARSYTKGGKIDRDFKAIKKTSGTSFSLSMDSGYKMSIALKNGAGEILNEEMVNLPLESLIISGSYANKILTLKLQSGDILNINITDIISGLVPNSRTINGKPLSEDVSLKAEDIGAASESHRHTILDFSDFPDAMTPTSHFQAASTVTAGTFAGAVIANSAGQATEVSLLRNSKLVSDETDPTVNGEICWTYE